MRAIITLAAAAMFITTTVEGVAAGFYTGNDMLEACGSNPAMATGYAMGFVDKATQSVAFGKDGSVFENKQFFCIPAGVIGSQVRDVICKAIEDTPATRHWSADVLASEALSAAWPCQ